jgi:hypothetical protein
MQIVDWARPFSTFVEQPKRSLDAWQYPGTGSPGDISIPGAARQSPAHWLPELQLLPASA